MPEQKSHQIHQNFAAADFDAAAPDGDLHTGDRFVADLKAVRRPPALPEGIPIERQPRKQNPLTERQTDTSSPAKFPKTSGIPKTAETPKEAENPTERSGKEEKKVKGSSLIAGLPHQFHCITAISLFAIALNIATTAPRTSDPTPNPLRG